MGLITTRPTTLADAVELQIRGTEIILRVFYVTDRRTLLIGMTPGQKPYYFEVNKRGMCSVTPEYAKQFEKGQLR